MRIYRHPNSRGFGLMVAREGWTRTTLRFWAWELQWGSAPIAAKFVDDHWRNLRDAQDARIARLQDELVAALKPKPVA